MSIVKLVNERFRENRPKTGGNSELSTMSKTKVLVNGHELSLKLSFKLVPTDHGTITFGMSERSAHKVAHKLIHIKG